MSISQLLTGIFALAFLAVLLLWQRTDKILAEKDIEYNYTIGRKAKTIDSLKSVIFDSKFNEQLNNTSADFRY